MMIFVGVNAVMYPNVCLLCVVVVVFGTKYTEWIEMVMKDNPNTSAKNNNIMGKSWRLLNKRHRNTVRIMSIHSSICTVQAIDRREHKGSTHDESVRLG
jgi:hypothetical protein